MLHRPPRGRTASAGKAIPLNDLPAEERARRRDRPAAAAPPSPPDARTVSVRRSAAAAHNARPAEERKRAPCGPAPAAEPGAAKTAEPTPPSVASGQGGEVLEVRRVRPDLLRLFIAKPAGLAYTPGQSLRLELEGTRRRYTLASAPHEPHLEFYVEIVPQGRMTSKIARLKAGDRVEIAGAPKGGIAFDESAARHLMLATVTGVNPFVSILRDALHRGRRDLNCVLVHGASHGDEFGYDTELADLARRRPDLLTYIPTVSRPDDPRNAGWQGAKGRAESLVPAVRRRFELPVGETAAYACGHPGMVDNARTALTELGYNVRTEKYD
ncbi:Ferredoxin--NADP(+) reductase [Caenispirillum salinarum AK4]|uniref:Ferredoxin--NADP(+) reductase n=1 Tax=Caenispirillum salinarum AK4 TaxID=1238182 RepID=K9H1V7_9PROT|nr:FAD-binding oxidoreductase [Caenispirillum salinarum]EKV31542.1 Ferredoxin--NADP(+) reductase [Caenispirillum salinarum AK4]